MTGKVKSARVYRSPHRQEQAAATRRDILTSAIRLFESQGYAATTMAAIASETGVALKTVYLAFETKSGILIALWNQRLRGDDVETPVVAKQWYREALEEPQAEPQLRLTARNSRAAKLRLGPVMALVRAAAYTDPDIRGLWERIQTEFHANQKTIVKSIDDKKALKPGLDIARATDILWTINHPDLWQLLVTERGWTPEQYEQWCGDTACGQLLAKPNTSATKRKS